MELMILLYEKKTDNDMFNFENVELISALNNKNKAYKRLQNFIKKRVHPESQKVLYCLLEEYFDSINEINNIEYQNYYIQGYKDTLSLLVFYIIYIE